MEDKNYNSKYYIENKERLLNQKKEANKINKARIDAARKGIRFNRDEYLIISKNSIRNSEKVPVKKTSSNRKNNLKEYFKEYHKNYYLRNRELLLERSKAYQHENYSNLSAKKKLYRESKPEYFKKKNKEWYKKNKEKIKEKRKNYFSLNKEKILNYNKKHVVDELADYYVSHLLKQAGFPKSTIKNTALIKLYKLNIIGKRLFTKKINNEKEVQETKKS